MRRLPHLPNSDFDYIGFSGGLDTVTPVIQAKPGSLREAQNYEIGINGGYVGVTGYERFDGQAKPSDAEYGILNVTITGSFAVGNTITGVTSTATATVLAVVTTVSPNYLVVTKIVGTFVAETLNVSGSPQGTITAAPVISGASTQILNAQYRNLAADSYRSDITAVTGSGSILGLWRLNGVTYAFRNNAGGTAAALYKSTTAGWSAVSLGRELSFTSGGTYVIAEGDTITGATSAATAVITRVVLESGSFAGGDAAGRLIFASDTGTFQAENLNVGANLNVATIAGDSSAITLSPSGRYEFVTHNFGGATGTNRIYGCDGVNKGFEFDGTVYVPITTGMATDAPTHVGVHANHLFYSFDGSAQHSGTGTPYIWAVISGAGELATGAAITAFSTEIGAEGSPALGIHSINSIHILYGTSSANWLLTKIPEEIGARAYSVAKIGASLFMSNRGITNLAGAQLSRLVQDFVNSHRNSVTAACMSRNKSQYRIFFTDETALYLTMSGTKLIGIMQQLLADKVECIFSTEDSDGSEVIMFGSDDGFVYQMEKGTSFDGDAIEQFLVFNFHHSKTPRLQKRYFGLTLEADGSGYAEFDFSYELGYASTDIPQPSSESKILEFSSGQWDTGTWDVGVWDGQTLQPANFNLDGSAENISLIIRSSSDYFSPIQFSGAMLRLLVRRKLR